MTKFTEKATAITPNREIQPDEYFNETDHLIYCSKCNTPRQCRHELQGKVLIPSIRCKCQQEIIEQEEAQRKLHEKQMEIEHLKTSGLQDKALYDNLPSDENVESCLITKDVIDGSGEPVLMYSDDGKLPSVKTKKSKKDKEIEETA